MTQEQGIARLFEVVDGDLRHPHYQRVVEKAQLYMALVTGEGLDKYLKPFARRESDELFAQRVDITEHITPCILKNILDVFQKVPRARYSKNIGYSTDDPANAKKLDQLEEAMRGFWGPKSLEGWFKARFLELNATDPNAFVVIEFEGTDGVKLAQPYPFEVAAKEAIDFHYTNMRLDYLIAQQQVEVDEGGNKEKRQRYTMYLENETLILEPVKRRGTPRDEKKRAFQWEGQTLVWLNDNPYAVILPTPHNIGRVPAFRVGYNRDLYTAGNTYVAPYEAAVPLLKKTLKINSEHDLSMTLTAHPYSIRYADPCTDCFKGQAPDGGVCHTCHGTGRKAITSGQEELVLDLPTHKDDFLDLSKLLVFVAPPIDVLKFQQEAIDMITRAAKATVFNSDILNRQEIQETATGKNIALQNLYDTLYILAEDYAAKWVFSVDIVARIIDRAKGLIAVMKFPRDFKMKDLGELFNDLKAAVDSGAGPEVVRTIEGQIVSTVIIDDPVELKRYATRQRINPFTGLTKDEIMVAINSDMTPNRTKVLYLNMGSIFDLIEEREGMRFYDLNPAKQREMVDDEVDKILQQLNKTAGAPALNLN